MRSLLAPAATFLLTCGIAWGQTEPIRVYTSPRLPPRDVLERLSLKMEWSTRLKFEGGRDGFFSIQLIPPVGQKNHLLLIQSIRGTVILVDAETGDTVWRKQVGPDYEPQQLAAWNEQTVFVVRRNRLHALDRDSGAEMLFDVQKDSNQILWGFDLEGVASAPLAADNERLFVCHLPRVVGYRVPDFRRRAKERAREEPPAGGKRAPSPQPEVEWRLNLSPLQFELQPAEYKETLGVVSNDATFVHINKFDGRDSFRYQMHKPVSSIAQYDNVIYMGSHDYNVYALDMARGKMSWRFAGMAPVVQPVHATKRDVWATPAKRGLHRIDRKGGEGHWGQADAERFLATNHRYVYAADRQGHLLVLDYDRGKVLAKYDGTRDWVVPVPNVLTDRLYLAAHDGQIVCLRHHDHKAPLLHWEPPAPPKPPIKKKDPPKKDPDPDKDKEKDKEKEKVKDKEKDKEKEKVKDKDIEKEKDKEKGKDKDDKIAGKAVGYLLDSARRHPRTWPTLERVPARRDPAFVRRERAAL